MSDLAFVRTQDAPILPAPRRMVGFYGWLRENLFSTPISGLLTIFVSSFLIYQAWGILDWAILRAVWTGDGREACIMAPREGVQPGACWAFVASKFHQFVYGFYPFEERWRVNILAFLFFGSLIYLAIDGLPWRRLIGVCFIIFMPILSYVLLHGGMMGLAEVPTSSWGGLLLTFVVACFGVMLALPFGILLAMGRRSELPVVQAVCVGYIEIWRGVPLITVLFMATVMLPLFLPPDWEFDKVMRVIVGVALFSAAYMAEAVRGGLQAIPRGQYEAAKALGLGYWRMMYLIILPQALKISIPGIVNTFISLFKDTTLVIVVGLLDFLGIIQAGAADQDWVSPETLTSGYFAAALIYWIICFSMSRYSIRLERRLAAGQQR